MKLKIRHRAKKRLPERIKQSLAFPSALTEIRSMDFISDILINGRRLRMLNIMDDFTRESLVIGVDTSLPSLRVIKV